jgi:hypothetical protein
MIFPYVRYEIDPTPAIPSGEVYRPRIPIRVIGPEGTVQVFALVDTGADHVFLSAALAEILGIALSGESETASGAGGQDIDVWTGSIEIEVGDDNERRRWRTTIGFLADDKDPPAAFLGNAGFLEHFVATFDYDQHLVELVAKS